MPKPKAFERRKKAPFRDAFLCIIICEGSEKEPEYFRHFDGLSSRIKVLPVKSKAGKSAPVHLIENALDTEFALGANEEDQIWFVIDTDRWGKQIHELRLECQGKNNWEVAQSNPCFEVWLYYHLRKELPDMQHLPACKDWKAHLHELIPGGFKSSAHIVNLPQAITYAKANYQEDGYWPQPGCTQVWRLAEVIERFIIK